MIKIKYSRESVCMGDDVNAGEYIITLNNKATLNDLIEILMNKDSERIYLIDELDSVLHECDIIVLTLPLTDETKGMFNKDKFDKMKDRTVLINIARGGIIDEQAMIDALKSGKLMGAGLDVFETEPLGEDSPLWSISNVLISPHNSFVSDKTADRLFEVILTNLKAFAEEV